jgi:serine/threonine protein phosphatase 1
LQRSAGKLGDGAELVGDALRGLAAGVRKRNPFARRPFPVPCIPAGERVYAIGDIHGCLGLYEELLALIERDNREREPARTTIVQLGDLIDRGPDSAGVVARAMAPLSWANTVTLRGNHEAAMLASLEGNTKLLDVWLSNGGYSALKSWAIEPRRFHDLDAEAIIDMISAAIPTDHLAWLRGLPLSHQIGDFYFVHAGVRPDVPLAEQREVDCLWIRDEFLDSKKYHGAFVVHGHSVTDEVEERPNRLGIDTGAYITGRLTALCLEGEDRWRLQTDGL